MSLDNELVARLQQQVGDRLQTQRAQRRSAGQPVLSPASEQQLARQMIAEVLRGHAESRMAEGVPPLPPEADDEISEAIYARMFGAGRLQRLLDDDSIENIDINGADEVWISRAGADYPELGEPVAANDAELIEMIQTLASFSGLSSRPFDAANPELDLQLPDGSRLSAVQAVAARPAVSIRRHRFQKVDLDDLVGLGTLTHETADFLRAIVAARFSVVIAGGTNAGKTTLLRAMAAEIPHRNASSPLRRRSSSACAMTANATRTAWPWSPARPTLRALAGSRWRSWSSAPCARTRHGSSSVRSSATRSCPC